MVVSRLAPVCTIPQTMQLILLTVQNRFKISFRKLNCEHYFPISNYMMFSLFLPSNLFVLNSLHHTPILTLFFWVSTSYSKNTIPLWGTWQFMRMNYLTFLIVLPESVQYEDQNCYFLFYEEKKERTLSLYAFWGRSWY
jgi:hypothetical protein